MSEVVGREGELNFAAVFKLVGGEEIRGGIDPGIEGRTGIGAVKWFGKV